MNYRCTAFNKSAKNMPFIDKVVDTALPFGMGLINGIFGDQRQLRQQERLQRLQIEGSKELSEFNRQQQMKMWLDTNYPAQVQQLKLAGLNPGLLYGHSGPGGTTGSPQASVQGAQAATSGGQEIAQFLGIGMQKEMLQAQKELIQAQAENVKADTAKKTGVDTREAETRILEATERIDNIAQQTDNARVQHQLFRLEETYKTMENWIKSQTIDTTIEQINTTTKQAVQQLELIKNSRKISDATINDEIQFIRSNAIGAGLKNILTQAQTGETRSNIEVNQKQINLWIQENMRKWDQMSQENKKIMVQELIKDFQTDPVNKATDQITQMVDNIFILTKTFPTQVTREPIGFKR